MKTWADLNDEQRAAAQLALLLTVHDEFMRANIREQAAANRFALENWPASVDETIKHTIEIRTRALEAAVGLMDAMDELRGAGAPAKLN